MSARAALVVAGALAAGAGVLLLRPGSPQSSDDQALIDAFHRLYYRTAPYETTTWLGVPSYQYPVDNWTMQEILAELKPDFVVETGTAFGGTALFYATVLAQVNPRARVLTVDIRRNTAQAEKFPIWGRRVEFFQGSSTAPAVVDAIRKRVRGGRVLVTLDSLHSEAHVSRELELYAPLVSVGSYLVVQDTHLGGHPNRHESVAGAGPWGAVESFLAAHPEFEADRSRERHLVSQNPRGYLRRVR